MKTNSLKLLLIIIILTGCSSKIHIRNPAATRIDEKITLWQEIILQHASPLESDFIGYRWSGEKSSKKLLKSKRLTKKQYFYYKQNIGTNVFGGGIYIAENPFTSYQFIPENDLGEIIEVTLEKGRLYLDLDDPIFLEDIKKAQLDKKYLKIILEKTLPGNISYRYSTFDDFWWIIKDDQGVKFNKFKINDGNFKRIYQYFLDLDEKVLTNLISNDQAEYKARYHIAKRFSNYFKEESDINSIDFLKRIKKILQDPPVNNLNCFRIIKNLLL